MSIYSSYNQSLPLITRILLKISGFLENYGLIIVLLLFLSLAGLWVYYRTKSGRKKIDQYILKLPGVGKIIRTFSLVNIIRNMGTMLENGVSLLKTIRVSQNITRNVVIRDAFKKVALKVERGDHLSSALSSIGFFPEVIINMVSVGEETGQLSSVLLQIADNLEQDNKRYLDRLMNLFEPLLLLVMGLVIGFIVISMLLPILGLNIDVLQ